MVMGTVFRSDDRLPPAERFAVWRDMALANYAPVEFHTDHADDFRATWRLVDLGPVQVSTSDSSPLRVHRSAKLVRQSDPEVYLLSLVQRGTLSIAQARQEATLAAGDL